MAADRDVTVDVVARDKTTKGVTSAANSFDKLNSRTAKSLAQIGDQWSRAFTKMRKATQVWADSGDGASKRFTKQMLAGVDRLGKMGGQIGGALSKSINAAGPYVQLALVGVLATAAAAAAPVIGAAITAGVLLGLGGGVLAAGIAAAARSGEVRAAWQQVADSAKVAFVDFGKQFEGPMTRAATTFGDALAGMEPAFARMGKALAPVVDMLAPALADMAKNAMPGIEEAVRASVPLFEALARSLPGLGESMSKFFSTIAKHGPEAAQMLEDIVGVIGALIEFTGMVVAALTAMYTFMRPVWALFISLALNAFGMVINAAAKAFGWVPGIGGKLKAAADKFNTFRDNVNRSLAGIKDQSVRIRVNVTGSGARFITGNAPGGAQPTSGGLLEFGAGAANWRPALTAAQFAGGAGFASGGSGGSRTGGPVQVQSDVHVSLDGAPFYAMTAQAVTASERRQAWRAKVGRR